MTIDLIIETLDTDMNQEHEKKSSLARGKNPICPLYAEKIIITSKLMENKQ